MTHRVVPIVAVVMLTLLTGGCANPWKDSFERNRDVPVIAPLPKTQQPVLREVEFERLQKFTDAERERRVNSTTAPADLSSAERVAAKDRLLEALQLPWRGDQAFVIGSSQFQSADPLNPPADKRLFEFASSVGADVIVVSSAYLGQTQRFTTVPVTSYSSDSVTYAYDGRGRRVPMTYNSTSTTWVPMNVTEDQYAYRTFFIRLPVRTDAAESPGTR